MHSIRIVQANGLSVFVFHLSVHPSACLSAYPSVQPPAHPSTCLNILARLPACLSMCLSVCLCTHLPIQLSEEIILYFIPH